MKYLIVAVLFIISGCATTAYQPLVDRAGPNYAQDLLDCQQYAQKVAGPGTGAIAGAVAGAVAGALLARLIGRDVARGPAARVGAATGAAQGGMQGISNEREVVQKCLRGRGYSVLH